MEEENKKGIKMNNNKKIEEKSVKSDGIKKRRLFAVIRISGLVKKKEWISETLDRLRLRRKYACILANPSDNSLIGMIKKIKYYVAYGEIEEDILKKLIKERAESVKGRKREIKLNEKDVSEGLMNGKKLQDFGLKPFFRLHPPRKGIKSKLQYPKGVLGYNGKDINKLIERML